MADPAFAGTRSERLGGLIGLLGDLVLPLGFLNAWLFPERYSDDAALYLMLTYLGEFYMLVLVLAFGFSRRGFREWLAILSVLALALWLAVLTFQAAEYVLTLLLASLAVRFVGLVFGRAQANGFPASTEESLLAIGLMMASALLVEAANQHDLPVFGHANHDLAGLGALGTFYFSGILLIRVLKLRRARRTAAGGSR